MPGDVGQPAAERARRLAGSRVGFLAALRPGEESFFERAGLPQYELGPLDEQAANALVSSRFPELAPRVGLRVVAEAQGNPLALLELPATLSGAQRAAAEALPAVLPLSRRLQALFASRASDLPEPARRLLLLAVLEGSGDVRLLHAAAGRQDIDDLAPAEQAGLVRVSEGTGPRCATHSLTFRNRTNRAADRGPSGLWPIADPAFLLHRFTALELGPRCRFARARTRSRAGPCRSRTSPCSEPASDRSPPRRAPSHAPHLP